MIPILYDKLEKNFTSNGLGRLSESISCKVTEKRNSTYQVTLEYPVCGKLANHLNVGNIVFCKTNYNARPQAFDIVESECTGNAIRITGEHISRRLKYCVFNRTTLFIVDPQTTFESINSDMRQNVIGIDDFNFFSDVTEQDIKNYLKDNTINLSSPPCSVGDNLLDFFIGQNGMLSRKMTLMSDGRYSVTGYGDCGDFLFDNFNVRFYKNRGDDAGVKLRTGSNVQRMTFLEEDRQSVTAVCPVWKGRNPTTGAQMEKSLRDFDDSSDGIVYSDKKYEYHRIVKLDLSTVFEQSPTKNEMIAEAQRYMKDHERNNLNEYCSYSIDVPQTKSDFLDCIELCDLVTIEDEDLKIQKKLKVTEIEYDSLRERIVRIVVGNPKPTFPELLERKNSIFIDNVNRSLTRTDDLSKKTTVEQKKYPVGYDPSHPEKWDSTGQTITDDTGKEMEEIAKINRHPVFVYKQAQSGGGTQDTRTWFLVQDYHTSQFLKIYAHLYENGAFVRKNCNLTRIMILQARFFVDNPKEMEQYGREISANVLLDISDGTHDYSVNCACTLKIKLQDKVDDFHWNYEAEMYNLSGVGKSNSDELILVTQQREKYMLAGRLQIDSGVSQ